MIPVVLAGIAVMCSLVANFYCDSIRFPTLDGVNTGDDDATFPAIELGPWYWKQTGTSEVGTGDNVRVVVQEYCAGLPSGTPIDAQWKTVRACSIMVAIVGGLALAAIAFNNCMYFMSDGQWKSLAVMFGLICTILQGLTLWIFSSNACSENPLQFQEDPSLSGLDTWDSVYESDCTWSGGSTANVISVICFLLTGLVMVKMGAPQRPPRAPVETQAVTYTQTVDPTTGAAVVVETQVVKGAALPPPTTTTTTTAAVTGVFPEEQAQFTEKV